MIYQVYWMNKRGVRRKDMTMKQRVIVRFYDLNGNHVRTDKFTLASYAGAWLRAMGYSAKGQATKGTYRSPEGVAIVDYGR